MPAILFFVGANPVFEPNTMVVVSLDACGLLFRFPAGSQHSLARQQRFVPCAGRNTSLHRKE
ncbi:MAG: hypothetical protein ACKO9F_03340 [Caldilinea sp.]